jgi:ABC-type transport system involved in multi-copper enzyme maturation permease subunit
MGDLVAAELLKLRTTRTVWALLAATVALTALAVTGAVMAADSGNAKLDLESEHGVRTVLHVAGSGAIFVLVLGIILAAGEYRQRTAVGTFLTTPRRGRVIAAKLVVGAGVGTLFGAIAAVVALGAANHNYQAKGYTFPVDSSDAWTILGGAILYAGLFGAIGAATGSLVRSQVGAIVGWLVWLAVAENILVELSPSVGRWLPVAAGRALVRDPDGELLSQPVAAVVLATYAAAIMAIAMISERRRDA